MISLDTPQGKWASSRLEGRTSWIFSSCGRCSRITTGTSGTRSGSHRKGQSPCELLGVLSGFLFRRCRGLRPWVESVPEPELCSPVLTWILGYFWSLPRGVSPRLELGHARATRKTNTMETTILLEKKNETSKYPSRFLGYSF